MSSTKIGTAWFEGTEYPLWHDKKQWQSIKFSRSSGFTFGGKTLDSESIIQKLNDFYTSKISTIVERNIEKMRKIPVKVSLQFTNGKENFFKEVTLTIDEYLKMIGFDRRIRFEVGEYEKEWGINEIQRNKKQFILYFNRNLIRLDNGDHIDHVVAHELAHIFIRDHGAEFDKVVDQLDKDAVWSRSFFDTGIRNVGKKGVSNTVVLVLLLVLLLIVGGIWLYDYIMGLIPPQQSLF